MVIVNERTEKEIESVEKLLMNHDSVRECAVIRTPHNTAGESLVAFVRCNEAISPLRLRAYLRDYLPAHSIPNSIIMVDALPLAENGEIDRGELARAFGISYVPLPADTHIPTSSLERAIVGIWEEVLQLEKIGTDAMFFDIGGNSLLAVQILTRIEDALGVNVTLFDIFRLSLKQLVIKCEDELLKKSCTSSSI